MSLFDSFLLFALLATLASIPSSSVLLIVTQSSMLHVRNGIAAAAGIAAGDLVFIALAIAGLSAASHQLGPYVAALSYLAAAYLIWFGVGLIRRSDAAGGQKPSAAVRQKGSSLLGSFGAGFFLTLGDIKAIIFYASVLPVVVDLDTLLASDIVLIMGLAAVSVGGVKVSYALVAAKASQMWGSFKHTRTVMIMAGSLMIVVAAMLFLRA